MAPHDFPPYVSAAERRRRAARAIAGRKKKGLAVEPVVVEGRGIARTFWGKAWCDHLERYGDFANRLPRGRTYLRTGSVIHLAIGRGCVRAIVQGTRLYDVNVTIAPLAAERWARIVSACSGKIESLVELLQGKLSSGVMKLVTDPVHGLFTPTTQIEIACSCPDAAGMCKHAAAVLYGVGARLDDRPELLFVLRGVDHVDLIDAAAVAPQGGRPGAAERRNAIAGDALADVFGIEIDSGVSPSAGDDRAPGR